MIIKVVALVVVMCCVWLSGCTTSASKRSVYSQYEQAVDAYNEGRFSDAEPLLRKLLKEHPQFAEGWFRLGNLYVRTGQNEAAITAFKTCLRYDASLTKARYNLSLVYLKMGVAALDEGIARTPIGSADNNQLIALKKALLGVNADGSQAGAKAE